MKILFMCVANSARSQLAEALAKDIFGSAAWIESAGSEPKSLNPNATAVLNEVGIDTSKQFSKSYDQLNPTFTQNINFIITLCAEEVCPIVVSESAQRLHWPFPDPAGRAGTDDEQIEYFRIARDSIREAILSFSKTLPNI